VYEHNDPDSENEMFTLPVLLISPEKIVPDHNETDQVPLIDAFAVPLL
jgi:hypothetical protein